MASAIVCVGLLKVHVVVLERSLNIGSEVGGSRLRRGGGRIGACLVDQLKHVLFLIGRSPARQQLTGFQVLESERAAELGPSHEDLRVYRIPAGHIMNRPRDGQRSASRKEIVLKGRSDFRKNSFLLGLVALTRRRVVKQVTCQFVVTGPRSPLRSCRKSLSKSNLTSPRQLELRWKRNRCLLTTLERSCRQRQFVLTKGRFLQARGASKIDETFVKVLGCVNRHATASTRARASLWELCSRSTAKQRRSDFALPLFADRVRLTSKN